MDVSHAIQTKRAVREFLPAPLRPAEVRTILNAGRRAQSAKNIQPWQFIAVQERPVLEALSKLGTWAGHLAGAVSWKNSSTGSTGENGLPGVSRVVHPYPAAGLPGYTGWASGPPSDSCRMEAPYSCAPWLIRAKPGASEAAGR